MDTGSGDFSFFLSFLLGIVRDEMLYIRLIIASLSIEIFLIPRGWFVV